MVIYDPLIDNRNASSVDIPFDAASAICRIIRSFCKSFYDPVDLIIEINPRTRGSLTPHLRGRWNRFSTFLMSGRGQVEYLPCK
jgi:hypothetical protein